MLAWLAWMAGCHLISSIQFPGMLHPVPELTYYYLIYQTHSGALGRTPLGIRILLIIFVFPKATEHCFRFPCLQPNSYNWRLVAGHSWLKCACFYSPQTPAWISPSDPNPSTVSHVSDLLPSPHRLPDPSVAGSVRAIPLPNSLGSLEAASTNTPVGRKSPHMTYGLFYSISSSIPAREPLLPRNHKPQWGKHRGLSCPFNEVGQEVQHPPASPPYKPFLQLQGWGHLSMSRPQEPPIAFEEMENKP